MVYRYLDSLCAQAYPLIEVNNGMNFCLIHLITLVRLKNKSTWRLGETGCERIYFITKYI